MSDSADGLGLDLELDQGRLTSLGAVRASEELARSVRGAPDEALRALDDFAAPAPFVVGHNVYWHDLPWLHQHAPRLGILRKPAVDTLLLSTLAFAEHPYHALIKDYKLTRDSVNDPTADARIALRLRTARFIREFSERQGTGPAPVAGVTATAKPEECSEIVQHFREELGQELQVPRRRDAVSPASRHAAQRPPGRPRSLRTAASNASVA